MASINTSPGRRKFGEDPSTYDAARPGYPPALFDWLRQTCAIDPQSVCFEIGAGTGHATFPILDLPVGSVLAIEPDTALATYLGRSNTPKLTIDPRRFEDVDLQPAAFDFAFCATAFHWLPRMKSFARIMAALKPGAHFAMWWSVFHDPANPDAFDRATAHLFAGLEEEPEKTASRPAFALDAKSRTGEMRSAGFAGVQHRLFSTPISFSAERLATLYGTFSRVRMAPEDTRERLLREVRRIVTDNFSGSVERNVIASVFTGRRPRAG